MKKTLSVEALLEWMKEHNAYLIVKEANTDKDIVQLRLEIMHNGTLLQIQQHINNVTVHLAPIMTATLEAMITKLEQMLKEK